MPIDLWSEIAHISIDEEKSVNSIILYCVEKYLKNYLKEE
jgi:hypothetical protein